MAMQHPHAKEREKGKNSNDGGRANGPVGQVGGWANSGGKSL